MAEDADKDSKTEEPTGKRLSDARNKGQVVSSREVGTAFLFLAATGLFFFHGQVLWAALQSKMRFFLSGVLARELTAEGVVVLIRETVSGVFVDLTVFFIVLSIMAIFAGIIQHGFVLSWEPIVPKLSKLNPINGIKRLFSMKSLVELVKSVLKMTVISLAVYWALKDSAETILGLTATNIDFVIESFGSDALKVLSMVTLAFMAMALLDFIYQKYEHIKGLRMTKQEVKDEQKQMEGDPMVKGRIRQIQREVAQRRMMEEVPKADVVITNPTRFAAVLVYKQGEIQAPRFVAKGRGRLAARIREVAKENRVPLVENPPLARSLFQELDLGQYVPPELFKAVAEVLAYVYSLKGRR